MQISPKEIIEHANKGSQRQPLIKVSIDDGRDKEEARKQQMTCVIVSKSATEISRIVKPASLFIKVNNGSISSSVNFLSF